MSTAQRMKATRLTTLIALAILLPACGGGGSSSQSDSSPPPVTCTGRAELCADALLNSLVTQRVDFQYYAPQGAATEALHSFMGTLTIDRTVMSMSAGETTGRAAFPRLSVQFMTVGDILLPLDRDVILGGASDSWDIILSPGKVWSEPNDDGMTRASFPFTLVTNQWNEAHNGVATFLYDDANVSNIHFQVVQETALWNKADMWGVARAQYSPNVIANAAQLEQDFLDELGQRVETRTWADLSSDYPDFDDTAFTRNISVGEISASGILVDNTLYLHSSNSRFGPYPYPFEMRHGVFSVTKSSQAALTLLRLAEKYGEQVFDLFVTDYLNVTANHSGWNGVTFGHLLNMVAGIGDRFPDAGAQVTFADENDESSSTWTATWNPISRNQKLAAAFRYGDYPWAPGQIMRYNTAHTFILGAALHSFYESMEGPGANVWQMMQEEVYRPIGLNVMPTIQTTGADPIPIYGFGLFLNAYDTARIAQLFSNDGAYEGSQILHRSRTRESTYKTANSGFSTFATVPLATGSETARYLNSFWSFTLSVPSVCTVRIPYMWGYGGNFVVVLPNGVSAFRYADANVHDPAALALATAGIRPYC